MSTEYSHILIHYHYEYIYILDLAFYIHMLIILPHTHTHTLSLSHTLSHTHALTHTHTLSLSHTHTHSLSHSHTHALTHTHTHTQISVISVLRCKGVCTENIAEGQIDLLMCSDQEFSLLLLKRLREKLAPFSAVSRAEHTLNPEHSLRI